MPGSTWPRWRTANGATAAADSTDNPNSLKQAFGDIAEPFAHAPCQLEADDAKRRLRLAPAPKIRVSTLGVFARQRGGRALSETIGLSGLRRLRQLRRRLQRIGLMQRIVVTHAQPAREAHGDAALVARACVDAFESEFENQAGLATAHQAEFFGVVARMTSSSAASSMSVRPEYACAQGSSCSPPLPSGGAGSRRPMALMTAFASAASAGARLHTAKV